jgi:hypothetical protein
MGRLSAASELAIIDRKLNYNPVRYVKLPKQVATELDTWSEGRCGLSSRRPRATGSAWHGGSTCTACAAARSWACGDSVDLAAATVTIGRARVLVEYKVIEKPPKSANGYRTLPLDADLVAALLALHDRQVTERMEAGEAYEDSGYVVTDELGRPVHPEWFSPTSSTVSGSAPGCRGSGCTTPGTASTA